MNGRPDVFDERNLNGHTIEDLSEYLDRGRTPRDESIESSAECRLALAALERLQGASRSLLERDAERAPALGESWFAAIFANVAREVRAGRDIPLAHPDPRTDLSLTEGAVRALIRSVGDAVPGALIGRCRLDGDVTVPGEPITVSVSVSALGKTQLPALADRVRAAISDALSRHTELTVAAIDVTIDDVIYDGGEG